MHYIARLAEGTFFHGVCDSDSSSSYSRIVTYVTDGKCKIFCRISFESKVNFGYDKQWLEKKNSSEFSRVLEYICKIFMLTFLK